MEAVFALSLAFFLGMFLLLAVTVLVGVASAARGRRPAPAPGRWPGVSVVVPAYNEGRNIRACLDSLRNAGYPGKLEVLVVDDGSTDSTIREARSRGALVVGQKHEGKVAALNRGIARARHRLVLTIDADTVLEEGAIQEVVRPFQSPGVGAVSGIVNVRNRKGVLGAFQSVEYPYISFLREVFSSVFRVAPGICGALTCYRKSVLGKVGGFRKTTALEDFDISFHIVKAGYEVVTAPQALGSTVVPDGLPGLLKQRVRWLKGSMQCVLAHRDVFARRRLAMNYILTAQLFWFIYSFFALPLMLFHFAYWLPANSGGLVELGWYFLRWFSLAGVAYMVWMIPQWGVNWVYIFGVLAGLVSSLIFLLSIVRYDRLGWRNGLAIFFFFPYTLLMSVFMMAGALAFFASRGKGTFVS